MVSEDNSLPVYTVRVLIRGSVDSLPENPLPSGEGVASLSEPGVGHFPYSYFGSEGRGRRASTSGSGGNGACGSAWYQ